MVMRGLLAILAATAIFASGDVVGAQALRDRDGVDNMKIADGEETTGGNCPVNCWRNPVIRAGQFEEPLQYFVDMKSVLCCGVSAQS